MFRDNRPRGLSGLGIVWTSVVLWFIGVILKLAFWGGVVYVAWHFIAKYW